MAVITSPDPGTEPVLEADGLDRKVGIIGMLWASEGSIIGSGWLFGPFFAVGVAGPSAIFGWLIASVIILILALVHAELGGLFPVSGGTSRYPHYAFGSFAGATFGWFSYFQAMVVAPVEVAAVFQYLSSAEWAHGLFSASTLTLTSAGLIWAALLMILFTAINLVGIQWLARTNSAITYWKVLLPIFAVIVLLTTKFHSGNFSADGGFFVSGKDGGFKAIVETFPVGVIFALLGFEQAVQLGGESANPKRDLPRAVIWSVLIGAAIYVLAQLAFIAALDPKTIASAKTWVHLGTNGSLVSGPFYTLARLAGLGWLAWLFRFDAVVSPGGTGLIYGTSSSRILFGLSKNGYLPPAFEDTRVRKVPWVGIIFSAAIGYVFLLPFPSWQKLVGLVTSTSVMMYGVAPLALGALRKQKAKLARVYKLPYAGLMAPFAFFLANCVVYYAGWQTYTLLILVLVVGYVLMGVSFLLGLNPNQPKLDWMAAVWVLPYLIGLGVISYLGGFGPGPMFDGLYGFEHIWLGGNGHLGIGWDNLALLVFSLAVYYLAMYLRLPEDKVDEYVREVYPPGAAH